MATERTVEITEAGLRYDLFLEHAWQMLVTRLSDEFADDPSRLMALKTAYWSGAATMLEALKSINDFEIIQAAVGAPMQLTLEQSDAMRADLKKGLDGLAATLNPMRRLDS